MKTEKKSPARKRAVSKRTQIDPGTDKRYVRRNGRGQFKESDDVGRSQRRPARKANTTVKPGQGDRGDQKRRFAQGKPAHTTEKGRRDKSRN